MPSSGQSQAGKPDLMDKAANSRVTSYLESVGGVRQRAPFVHLTHAFQLFAAPTVYHVFSMEEAD